MGFLFVIILNMTITQRDTIAVSYCCEYSKKYDVKEKLRKFAHEYCECGQPILIYREIRAAYKNIKKVQT